MFRAGRFIILTAIIIFGFLPGVSAFAQERGQEQLFTVYGLDVDVRAASSGEAKRRAMNQAENEGFRALLRRLVPEEYQSQIFLPEGFNAASYVLGLEVEDERTSRVRYIGRINVTFDSRQIEEFLSGQNIPYVAFAPPKRLVFPLFWHQGSYVLWGDKNIFRKTWDDDLLENRLNSFAVVEGTPSEISTISARQVVGGRQENQLRLTMNRYGVDQMVAIGAKINRATNGAVKSMDLEIFQPLEGFAPERRTYYPGAAEHLEDFIERGLREYLDELDNTWKIQATTQVADVQEMALMVPTDQPGTWAQIKTRLEDTPIISGINIARLAVPESYIAIQYSGTEEQLALALRQKGLILFRAGRGYALIRQEDAPRYLAERGD